MIYEKDDEIMRKFDYTNLKNKTWDSNIINMIGKIHEAKARQELYLSQKTDELNKLVELSKIQSTEASNAIEGIRTTDTRLKKLLMRKQLLKIEMRKKLRGIEML